MERYFIETFMNLANTITLFRLFLVFVISALALYATPKWQLLNAPLVIIMFSLDGLDGIVARARNEASIFGAVFDIAADRIIEITLWVVLAKLNLISIWVAIIFVTRGILVDSLRNQHVKTKQTPFSIMQTKPGKFLVASREMRIFYATIKLITFAWLLFIPVFSNLWIETWNNNLTIFNFVSSTLIYIAVATCLLRGIPVLLEALF